MSENNACSGQEKPGGTTSRGVQLDRKGDLSQEPGIVCEIWEFLRERKRIWLAPIIFALLFLGFLLVVTGSAGVLSPFLYAL